MSRSKKKLSGIVPLIMWAKTDKDLIYGACGFSYDTGCAIDWAVTIGLCQSAEETESLAKSVPDSGGIYFIPAFAGLQVKKMSINTKFNFV